MASFQNQGGQGVREHCEAFLVSPLASVLGEGTVQSGDSFTEPWALEIHHMPQDSRGMNSACSCYV